MVNRGDARRIREHCSRVTDERRPGPTERRGAGSAGEQSENGPFCLGRQMGGWADGQMGRQHERDYRPSTHPPICRSHCSLNTVSRGPIAALIGAPVGAVKLIVNPGSFADCVASKKRPEPACSEPRRPIVCAGNMSGLRG